MGAKATGRPIAKVRLKRSSTVSTYSRRSPRGRRTSPKGARSTRKTWSGVLPGGKSSLVCLRRTGLGVRRCVHRTGLSGIRRRLRARGPRGESFSAKPWRSTPPTYGPAPRPRRGAVLIACATAASNPASATSRNTGRGPGHGPPAAHAPPPAPAVAETGEGAAWLRGRSRCRHAYRPVLLESYAERHRFHGTHRAANWIHLGQTQGRGKLDRYHQAGKPIKDIYAYPLAPRFRSILTAPLPGPPRPAHPFPPWLAATAHQMDTPEPGASGPGAGCALPLPCVTRARARAWVGSPLPAARDGRYCHTRCDPTDHGIGDRPAGPGGRASVTPLLAGAASPRGMPPGATAFAGAAVTRQGLQAGRPVQSREQQARCSLSPGVVHRRTGTPTRHCR